MSIEERVKSFTLRGSRVISRSVDSFLDKYRKFEHEKSADLPTKRRRNGAADSDSPNTSCETEHEYHDTVENVRNYEINLIDFSLLDRTVLESRTMAEPVYMSLKEARTPLPRFDGSKPEEVDDIINAYEYANDSVNPNDRGDLLKAVLKTKIVGKAAKDIKYKQIDSYKKFRDEMTALYGTQRTIAALQVEFNTCKQMPGETVLAYGQRLEKIMMDLIDASTAAEDNNTKKQAIEEYIRQTGLHNFERGLRREYQIIVKARGFADLSTAMKGAMEEEKTVQGNESIHKQTHSDKPPPMKCHNCGKPGHLARDCRSPRGRFSLPTPGPSRSINTVDITCNYCKKRGHVYKDCRKRLREQGAPVQDQGNNRQHYGGRNNYQGNQRQNGGNRSNQWQGGQGRNGQGSSQQNQNGNSNSNGNSAVSGISDREPEKKTLGMLRAYTLTARTSEAADQETPRVFNVTLPTASETASDFHIASPLATTGILTLKADTGAQCSIIKESALTSDTPIEDGVADLAGVAGKIIKPLCKAQVTLDTPTVAVRHWFYVVSNDVPLNVDGLLGMDFIKKHKADIIGGETLKLYGHCMPLIDGAATVILPPRSENLLHAKTKSKFVGILQKAEIAEGIILGA